MANILPYALAGLFLITTIIGFITTDETFVCYDGSEREDMADCPSYPATTLEERQASTIANNYGNAIQSAKGDNYNQITTYWEGGNYYSSLMFSDREGGYTHEMLVQVNGTTGRTNCVEGCDYITGVDEIEDVDDELDELDNDAGIEG